MTSSTFGSSTPTVLIVDDHAPNLLAMEVVLEPLALELLMARDAEAAMELSKASCPTLIITDMRMGGISGADFVAWLRRTAGLCTVPVLIVSGVDPDDEALCTARQLPGVSFLQKPYSAGDLRAVVMRLLTTA